MRLFVGCSSIGGPLELVVPRGETRDGLRTRLSRQLGVHKDRIVLLHKDKQLAAGKLLEQGVADGSRLTLQVPVAVGAALFCSGARAETIMDVLERLADCEISNFLSGRSPLAIKLGMGAHTMHVQLQLTPQDVAKLQPNKASEAISSPPAEVNLGQSASSRPPTHTTTTSAAYSPPAAYSASSMQSEPQAVLSMDRRRRATAHRSRPHAALSMPSFRSTCPLPATTPVSYNDDSIAPSRSPLPASTFKESFPSSAVEAIEQPGAVIESFAKHSQGVFSGTFSGTLAPCIQSGVSPRGRSIAMILQILNDLLRAASHHQGALSSLCPGSDGPIQERHHKQSTKPPREAPAEEAQPFLTNSQENQTLHCKLKHLQSLMVSRRQHRRTHDGSQVSRPGHPYRRHHRP
ncbi:midnolin-like [Syngnathoides biaculeatus]|uniref:midnolin-like n=1 Tax=Syngnathoides biaculeatus TaxID=300417 RepID=UPI002ADDCEC6|nr:midnolin-like [Syngnathoides biaculeatus]